MKGFFANFGIALCGLTTSILVALAVTAIERITTLNIFSFSIWFIVPAGAIGTGFAAASGYYFGSLYFHQRATGILLVQMVLIAGASQLLIYWTGYQTMVLENGVRVADFLPFEKYMQIVLTTAHYRMGRAANIDTGEVGNLGYWLAGLQFIGFLIGGLVVFGVLKAKAVCGACNLYLRPLAKKVKQFETPETATAYLEPLFSIPVDSDEFAQLVRSDEPNIEKSKGSFQVTDTLLGCPSCKSQLIDEEVEIWNGKEWKTLEKLHRRLEIPAGIDLIPIFRG